MGRRRKHHGFLSGLKKFGHTVTHPQKIVKEIEKAVVKAEKDIEKGVVKAGKDIKKAVKVVGKEAARDIHVVNKGLTEVVKHTELIKKVVITTATVVEAIGTATGQPEIVAGAAAIEGAVIGVIEAVELAQKAFSVADKAIHIAKAIKEKKKLSTIMHMTADAMSEAAGASGNQQLKQIAGHVKKGAKVVEMSAKHTKTIAKACKKCAKAIDKIESKPKTKPVAKSPMMMNPNYKGKAKNYYPNYKKPVAHHGKCSASMKKRKLLPMKKRKRSLSKYNLFVKKQRLKGLTLKQISPLWQAQKGK